MPPLYPWCGTIEPSWNQATSLPPLPHTMTPASSPVLQSSGLVPCAGPTGLSGGWKWRLHSGVSLAPVGFDLKSFRAGWKLFFWFLFCGFFLIDSRG